MLAWTSDLAAAVAVAVLFFAAGHAGFTIASRRSTGVVDSASFGMVQAAAFTLVSLLLAFSFSVALGRYDARRALVTAEANAIGTTIMRADLLPAAARVRERELLREYLATRLIYVSAQTQPNARNDAEERSATLQHQMWVIAALTEQSDTRSGATPLFIAALNDSISLSLSQRAALRANIPPRILIVLIAAVLAAAVLFGLTWKDRRSAALPLIALSVIFGVVVATIVDLDESQAGWIRTDLSSLQSTAQLLR